MKIKTKLMLTIIVSLSLICLLISSILHFSVMGYIKKQEIEFVYDDYHRAFSMIQREQDALESVALDWSQWDESYYFTEGTNPEFISVNLLQSSLHALDLNLMLFVNEQGEKLYAIHEGLPVSGDQIEGQLLQKLYTDAENTYLTDQKPVTEVIELAGQPFLISVAPITTSDLKATPSSFLIMGRLIDESFVGYLGKVLKKDVSIQTSREEILSREGIQQVHNRELTLWIDTGNGFIRSAAYLPDHKDRRELLLILQSDRALYRSWLDKISLFFDLMVLTFVINGIILWVGLSQWITGPIEKLHRFMKEVENKKDTAARITLGGKDEMADLAASTNGMLKALDDSYLELKIIKERFRLTTEATNDGYFDIHFESGQCYLSPALSEYESLGEGVGGLKQYMDKVHPEDRKKTCKAICQWWKEKDALLRLDYRAPLKKGGYCWVLIRGKIVERDDKGRPLRAIGTLSDIQSQKKVEEENLYLSETDVVTTLKNRASVEKVLNNIQSKSGQSWIIMGDVNGLKIINDSFGHQEGDRLLWAVGAILKKCCAPDDVAARWGGDEFIIVVRDKGFLYIDDLLRSIKKECEEISGFPIKVSIALGCAERTKRNNDLNGVLKLAEERMYRHKLLESRSARSAIIASLEQSLHEKHIETEAHTKRIKKLCMEIGTSINLSQDELDELALLGVLHDIGKIAIPEAVLMKPGALTPAEWEIMKTHSEIGYRIVAATPELAHIADEILFHHERYDGSGYPQGLKGHDIPKLSRLLTIVDSFDVMTHDRHYKKAMGIDEAVRELKECSGKQFDPEMVKAFVRLIKNNKITL